MHRYPSQIHFILVFGCKFPHTLLLMTSLYFRSTTCHSLGSYKFKHHLRKWFLQHWFHQKGLHIFVSQINTDLYQWQSCKLWVGFIRHLSFHAAVIIPHQPHGVLEPVHFTLPQQKVQNVTTGQKYIPNQHM